VSLINAEGGLGREYGEFKEASKGSMSDDGSANVVRGAPCVWSESGGSEAKKRIFDSGSLRCVESVFFRFGETDPNGVGKWHLLEEMAISTLSFIWLSI